MRQLKFLALRDEERAALLVADAETATSAAQGDF
jgi:hypothetical protein